jgi:FkbM family methyltransferase
VRLCAVQLATDDHGYERVKSELVNMVPKRFHVPLRYWHRKLAGRLDPELALLCDFVRDGDTCVDIGANHGLYSYALARRGAIVHAFEPQPACAGVIRAFRSRHITVHQVALSDHSGHEDLFVPLKSGRLDSGEAAFSQPDGAHERITVPVQTLDAQELGLIRVIKIDVEGHELEVLNGAVNTLAKSRPVVLTEIEQRHLRYPMQSVFDSLLRQGYVGYFLWRGRTRHLDDFSCSEHQIPERRLQVPMEYVNNFFFVHRDDPRSTVMARRAAL